MTTIVEYYPIAPVDYPEEDGKPMAESDEARDYLTYATEVLKVHFQNNSDVYVSGNLFIYYEKGNPESVVAPDVFVVIGIDHHQRRSYETWEENNKIPDFVLEITSKATRSKDQGAKKGIYAFLGVKEYFQYDPTGDYLNPQLQGLKLIDDNYFPIETSSLADGTVSLVSEVLGLELRLKSGKMRFYNPTTTKTLLTYEEESAARKEAEEKAQKLADKLRELNIDPDSL
jgi:Uma2 family endonuclease